MSVRTQDRLSSRWWLWLTVGVVLPTFLLLAAYSVSQSGREALSASVKRTMVPSDKDQAEWGLVDTAREKHRLTPEQWASIRSMAVSDQRSSRANAAIALAGLTEEPDASQARTLARSMSGDSAPTNRFFAAMALKRLGDPGWREACRPLLKSEDPWVAQKAQKYYDAP